MQYRCRKSDCDDIHVPSCILLDADVKLKSTHHHDSSNFRIVDVGL